MLYNILWLINQYSSSIAISVIAKTMNNIGISMVISSDLQVIASAIVIASDLLDISNPHEYADICY